MLNATQKVVDYFTQKGGFFNRVNAMWVDAAVARRVKIFLITDTKRLYRWEVVQGKLKRILTGYGKEVHRFEWKHSYRFDPKTKMMIPPQDATGLEPLTKFEDYKIIN